MTFSLAQLVKMIDIEGISSFGLLVTFYLSIWKVPKIKWFTEGAQKKRFYLGLCPKLWVGGGPKSQTF